MRSLSQLAQEARDTADWRPVEAVYNQCVSIVRSERSKYLPRALTGRLAGSFERLSPVYRDQYPTFSEHALGIFAEVEGLSKASDKAFLTLYNDHRFDKHLAYRPPETNSGVRRRPTPFESCVETNRRLRDLNEIEQALLDVATAGIVGGSMSYGRYFNVAGTPQRVVDPNPPNPSDLDLLLVVPDVDELASLASHLEKVEGIDRASLRALATRIDAFVPVEEEWYFSHKLGIWRDTEDPALEALDIGAEYYVNLHVFTEQNFAFLALRDVRRLDESAASHREILDIREDKPKHSSDHQRSFAGTDLWSDREATHTDGGFAVRERVFTIHQGRYYPGMMQNLLLPLFDLQWDNTSPRATWNELEIFRSKVFERLREERRLSPYDILRPSLSHTRSQFFSPSVRDTLDNNFIYYS